MTADANIVLTGFMGTGKSSVGRRLARELGFTFVDTDEVIESRSRLTVQAIFRERGEAAFREMEAALARELGQGCRQVIATGGRLMLDAANAAVLSRNGRVFCLWAEPEEILSRVTEEKTPVRPLLQGPDPAARIRVLLDARRRGYGRFEPILTTGKRISEVVQELLDRIAAPDAP